MAKSPDLARAHLRIARLSADLTGGEALNEATTAIRPFQDQDEAAVVGVWHRSGQSAYPFLPSWQRLTLGAARDIFRERIRPRCTI